MIRLAWDMAKVLVLLPIAYVIVTVEIVKEVVREHGEEHGQHQD